jgi:hypothetical protein
MDLEQKFQLVKSAGVFDYFDKTPSKDRWSEYARLSEKYDIPILAGSWYYTLGRDEALIEQNIKLGALLGSKVHNIQIMMDHASGHLVSDEEVAEAYLRAYDIGGRVGCLPSFEVHINMWSEDFRRVLPVANLVQRRGVPFRLTLDHSHVIFKIDNPVEQAVFSIDESLISGSLILDPFEEEHICGQWIEADLIAHVHLRSAVPNNPKNLLKHHPGLDKLTSSLHPKNTVGRGVQYPFIEPRPDEWFGDWNEAKLEPWKEVVRQALVFNQSTARNPFTTMTTEFIPFADYGGGAKYSIFENGCACAEWARQEIIGLGLS